MKGNKLYAVFVLTICVGLIALAMPSTPAKAQGSLPENGNCVTCHEDLYFLHDTGNWFCLKDSPMRCVDCHGGNPAALTQEEAHYDRAAHPVVNEDISRCETCHMEECTDRVTALRERVQIHEVREAAYLPASTASNPTENLSANDEPEPVDWVWILEIVPLIVLGMIALTIYLLNKLRRA
ncbi:MAG: hypothetical protein Kow002_07800 [Anaerolineales bacterium]